MKLRHSLHPRLLIGFLVLAGLALASKTVSAADQLPPKIAERLDPKWIATAKCIDTPEYTIYYQGSATGKVAADGRHWLGEIEGEILLLSPSLAKTALILRIGPDASLFSRGPSVMQSVQGVAPWQKLLHKVK